MSKMPLSRFVSKQENRCVILLHQLVNPIPQKPMSNQCRESPNQQPRPHGQCPKRISRKEQIAPCRASPSTPGMSKGHRLPPPPPPPNRPPASDSPAERLEATLPPSPSLGPEHTLTPPLSQPVGRSRVDREYDDDDDHIDDDDTVCNHAYDGEGRRLGSFLPTYRSRHHAGALEPRTTPNWPMPPPVPGDDSLLLGTNRSNPTRNHHRPIPGKSLRSLSSSPNEPCHSILSVAIPAPIRKYMTGDMFFHPTESTILPRQHARISYESLDTKSQKAQSAHEILSNRAVSLPPTDTKILTNPFQLSHTATCSRVP